MCKLSPGRELHCKVLRVEVTVLGAGSWGTALALLAARVGHGVRLWGHRSDLVAQMSTRRENAYLPGVPLPETLAPVADLRDALLGAELVLLVVPSHGMRAVIRSAGAHMPSNAPLVSCSKGIENETLCTMDEVLRQARS